MILQISSSRCYRLAAVTAILVQKALLLMLIRHKKTGSSIAERADALVLGCPNVK